MDPYWVLADKQLYVKSKFNLQDLPGARDDWDGLREKESGKFVQWVQLQDDDDNDDEGMKVEQSYKSYWVKITIDDCSSQDVESNESQW